MILIFGILIFAFIIGLPFVLIYKTFKRRKTTNVSPTKFSSEIEKTNQNVEFSFMKDYKMWGELSKEKKEERLMDISVILDVGKDLLKKEMIDQGFLPGSKIIDVNYFTGLSQFGTTITGFLIQNESGGEIRELSIRIDLEKMMFKTNGNRFYHHGKERYYYLKSKKGLVNI